MVHRTISITIIIVFYLYTERASTNVNTIVTVYNIFLPQYIDRNDKLYIYI